MEYVQMTLNDWVEMKQKLKRELMGVKQSFVRIGFMLRKIEEGKLYENDGYKSVAEFAKAELGLEASTTSRFISINREYSVDGYSEVLSPEYAELGRSQLEEMLKLPEEDRKMVQPGTSRQDIRDLKKFNKSGPETGVADGLREVIENFYKDNKETLNAVFSEKDMGTGKENIRRLAETINPSGNRSYRKGLFFLIMYEDKIAVKKFGESPQEMTWEEFIGVTVDIFRDAAAGGNTWQGYFGQKDQDAKGQEEPRKPGGEYPGGQQASKKKEPNGQQAPDKKELNGQQSPDEKEPDRQQDPDEKGADEQREPGKERESRLAGQDVMENSADGCGETEGTAIAPAQKTPENTEPEAGFQEAENPEGMGRPYGNRKAYLDKQTEYAAALYIAASIKGMRNMTFTELTDAGRWEKWLRTEVDDSGEEIDIVG